MGSRIETAILLPVLKQYLGICHQIRRHKVLFGGQIHRPRAPPISFVWGQIHKHRNPPIPNCIRFKKKNTEISQFLGVFPAVFKSAKYNTRPSRIFFKISVWGNHLRKSRIWKFRARNSNSFWVIISDSFWSQGRPGKTSLFFAVISFLFFVLKV